MCRPWSWCPLASWILVASSGYMCLCCGDSLRAKYHTCMKREGGGKDRRKREEGKERGRGREREREAERGREGEVEREKQREGGREGEIEIEGGDR